MKRLVNELIAYIAEQLTPIYDHEDEREQVAWWLIEELTKKSKADLLVNHEIELVQDQENLLKKWISEHVHEKKPLQYIIGFVPFDDVEILCEPPTLIPRPETEEWVINLSKELKKLKNQKIAILDIGAGSGAISIALAKALPEAEIFATDISQNAINLASKNVKHNNVDNVTLLYSDIFSNIPITKKFDLIISNPPYISSDEWKKLDPMVKDWEDKNALVTAHQGLLLIEKIIKEAPAYLVPNEELFRHGLGQLYIEIGYRQADQVKKLMTKTLYNHIKVLKDLEGKDRVVTGRI